MKYSLAERKIVTKGDYWIAPGAVLIGSVVLENNASIWFNVASCFSRPYKRFGIESWPRTSWRRAR